MPEISRFFGITIKMFWDDHNPPHFHAEYAGEVVQIDLCDFSVLHGSLSRRALGLIRD